MPTNSSQSIRFAIDTGGTFTDIVVLNEADGTFFLEKSLTTPENTLRGVLNVIDKARVDLSGASRLFVHGSTTALNALLERKGAKTAYVTTRGFRDVPEIGRYNRPEMYNPKYRKPPQIVPRSLRFDVDERIGARGELVTKLDEEGVRVAAKAIRKEMVQAVAVCTLHAFKNPVHERRIREILVEECPGVAVTISSDVIAEHREYERSMTTILNAYLAPVVEKWVGELEAELRGRGFKGEIVLTKSDGGGMSTTAAKVSPISTLLSGPSGGVIGGLFVASITGRPNLITMDMGGTSFDVAMIKDGYASTNQETKVCGYPLLMPNLDIRAIGAGGGSIAKIDAGGALSVGPQSAGAEPGPICYRRRGVEPTVTDAMVCNGYINLDNFLGGEMSLDAAGAKRGIQKHVCDPLGLSLERGASGILRIALSNMAEAIKDISAESGDDPREFGLLCYGGGGPIFGSYLMEELSIPVALIPLAPAAFSAWGMLMVDLRHDAVKTVTSRLEAIAMGDLEKEMSKLENQATALLARDGIVRSECTVHRSVDMRYAGQEHAVSVSVDFDLREEGSRERLYKAFERVYEAVYGYTLNAKADIVNARVKAIGRIPKPSMKKLSSGGDDPRAAFAQERKVFDLVENSWIRYRCYDRTRLQANNVVMGPAIVEEATTLTTIRPGQRCTVDQYGNLIITY